MSEPEAVAVHLEDMDVMGEAVEQSAGQPLGSEDLGPFLKRQVGVIGPGIFEPDEMLVFGKT